MTTAVQAVKMLKAFASQYRNASFSTFSPLPDGESGKDDLTLHLLDSVSEELVVQIIERLQPFQFISEIDSKYSFAVLGIHQNLALDLKMQGPMIWYKFRRMTGTESILSGADLVPFNGNQYIEILFSFLPGAIQTPSSCQARKAPEVAKPYLRRMLQSYRVTFRSELDSIVNQVVQQEEFGKFFSGYRSSQEEENLLSRCSARMQKYAAVCRYLQYISSKWQVVTAKSSMFRVSPSIEYKASDLRVIILSDILFENPQLGQILIEWVQPPQVRALPAFSSLS